MPETKSKVLVILGPTASGKSDLAVDLAHKFGGEVISADSRQVYRGLDIGTGKITKREMRGVRHYLLDIASPKKVFSVAQYQTLAKKAIKDILRRGKLPIICGGTGLYIDALLYGWSLPKVAPDKKLRAKLDKQSAEKLFARLKKLDPNRAANIDRHNKRRLVRALEIVLKTGKPVPSLIRANGSYDILKIGLRPEDAELRARIHKRLLRRLRQGMIKEAERLRRQGLSFRRMEELGLEYRYLARFLQNKISRKEMVEKLEKEIRRYAKHQMTWFSANGGSASGRKRDGEIHWVKNAAEAQNLALNFLRVRK